MRLDADQYAAALIMRGLADNTVRNYRCLFQRWHDWCTTEGHDPTAPNALTVRAWSRTIHGSRSMLAQAAAMVGHLCEVLELPDDLTGAVPVPRPPRRKSRALETDDARKLEAQAHTAGIAGTAVLVGMYTGARRSEIAGMQWRHVAEDSITFWRPKTKDWHTMPLHGVLAEHLHVRRTGEQWLFPGRHGGHVAPAVIWEWTLEVAEAAGIGRVTPHQLRHTFITWAYGISKDLKAAQDLAGHRSPVVTAGYTRVGEDRAREVVNMVDYRAS